MGRRRHGCPRVTPFVLSLVLPRHRPRRALWAHVEAAVLFALIALVSLTAIGTDLQFLGDGADAGPPGAGAGRSRAGRSGAAADVPAVRNQPVPEERGRRAGGIRAEASPAGGPARRGPTGRPHRKLGVDDPAESGPSRTSPRAGRPNASTGSPRRCSGAFCRTGSPNFPACGSPRAMSRPAPTWRSAAACTTSCNSQTGGLAWPSATWPATGCERLDHGTATDGPARLRGGGTVAGQGS